MPTAKKLTTSATIMKRTRIVPIPEPRLPLLCSMHVSTEPTAKPKITVVSDCPFGTFRNPGRDVIACSAGRCPESASQHERQPRVPGSGRRSSRPAPWPPTSRAGPGNEAGGGEPRPARGLSALEYRIDGVLGQGGFGIAYAATDVNLNAKVVVKEYLPEEFAYRAADNTVSAREDEHQEFYQVGLDSFLVEARTLATFRHRNIVRVARFFEANKTAYMVLEYERGQSLKAWRRNRADIPEEALVSLLAPLLDGLELVHRSGYLHRDIKPDNIYVRDEDGSLVLLDFGAARQTATEHAEVGTVVTPGYGPIEEYAGGGRQGPWTDIYSLGATLYWLVTGRKPPESPSRLADPDPLLSAEDQCRGRYSARVPRSHRLGAAHAPGRPSPGHRPVALAAVRRAPRRPRPAGGAAQSLRRGPRARAGRGLDRGAALPAGAAGARGEGAPVAAPPRLLAAVGEDDARHGGHGARCP